MSNTKQALLRSELQSLQQAAAHLQHSVLRCAGAQGWQEPTPEQLERLESLASRFARLTDILIQRIFRLADELELVGSSTVLDRIYRAEKRQWVEAESLINMRELRNLIAHEYAADAMAEIYNAVLKYSPILLATIPKITQEATRLLTPRNPESHA
jgi:hypothetical protein